MGIFCSVLAICLVLFGLVNYYFKAEEKEMLQRNFLLTQIISHEVESGYLKGLWPYKTLKMVSDDENVLLFWVVKPNGEIFWADDPEMLGKIIEDPFLGVQEVKHRNSYLQGEQLKLIARPIKIALAEKPWTLFLGVSFAQLRRAQREMIVLSSGFLVLIAVFIGFIAFYFATTITRPLKQLSKGAEIVGGGNLDYRMAIKTKDEFGELGRAFNQMAESLQKAQAVCGEARESLEIRVAARTKELKEFTERLEETVKERTRELQERVNELERFHRLTVGRELKMLELKRNLRESQEIIKTLEQKTKAVAARKRASPEQKQSKK